MHFGWVVVLVITGSLLFFGMPGSGLFMEQSVQPPVPGLLPAKSIEKKLTDTSGIIVYPNPVSSTLHIVVRTKSTDHVKITILQINGQLIREISVAPGRVIQIDMRSFPTGSYIVRAVDRTGRIWTAKFEKGRNL